MSSLKKITIHTDGGCEGNPGPGGWAAVLEYGGRTKEVSGGEAATTNNRMELRASIAALEALTEPCEVDLFTDSTYLRDHDEATGEKRGSLAGARRGGGTAPRALAVVERPRRPRGQ